MKDTFPISKKDMNPYIDNFNNHISALESLRNMVEWHPYGTVREGSSKRTLTFTGSNNKSIIIGDSLPENEKNEYVRLKYVFIIKSKWWDENNNKVHTYYRICGLSQILLKSDGDAITALNSVAESVRNTQLLINGNECKSLILEYSGFKLVLYNSRGYTDDKTALLEDPDAATLDLMKNFPIYEEYYPYCHLLGTDNTTDITTDIVYACMSQVVFARRILGRNNHFLGFPDWSNASSITITDATRGHTFVQDGYLLAHVYHNPDGSGKDYSYEKSIYVNNKEVGRSVQIGSTGCSYETVFVPVSIGDFVTVAKRVNGVYTNITYPTDGGAMDRLMFIPFK